ncbi:uncharacterized protein LOC121508971 [Cheilinus undulatus]|uniref:uncharacterized protein LOC121508971 n=1 Tax=Cheilinus undulatus TaxID=241271 RepID=UPI001BD215CC|nr:uncharacterized protein LOC121508971 [Cheilinus undulatus]
MVVFQLPVCRLLCMPFSYSPGSTEVSVEVPLEHTKQVDHGGSYRAAAIKHVINGFSCHIQRRTMPSWGTKTSERKISAACAITSLVLLVGLLIFVVIFMTLCWQNTVGEDELDDCSSKATVVTDEAVMQRWGTWRNLSQAWSEAEQKARAPAHIYMEKHHSVAIYMYTSAILQPVKPKREEQTAKQKETFESRSLFSSLSEAVQILKHSQVTCLSTSYRTDTLLYPNISNKLIRFSNFMLGSDWWNSTRNAYCFEVYTCFGANVTHYSALKEINQVLIPPYEAFKVTAMETDVQRCKVLYKLRSNLNCVYDRESNMLHPISAIPVEGFWLIFGITCMVVVSLLFPFIIVKVRENHEKRTVYNTSSMDKSIYHLGTVKR